MELLGLRKGLFGYARLKEVGEERWVCPDFGCESLKGFFQASFVAEVEEIIAFGLDGSLRGCGELLEFCVGGVEGSERGERI